MTQQTRDRLCAIALGLIILLAIVYRLYLGPHIVDDAYITFRYARNLAEGQGFVYNPGERVLGTSTPFFALLLALGMKLGGSPSRVALAIDTLADAFSLTIIYLICRKLRIPTIGLLAAWMLAISSQFVIYSVSGMETSFYVAVLLTTWGLYTQGHITAAFALAGLGCIIRPDAVLMVAALYADLLLSTRRIDLRPIAVALLAAAPWLLFATLYFGSPVPMSMQAKAADASVADAGQSLRALKIYFLNLGNSPAGRDKNLLFTFLFALGGFATVKAMWLKIKPRSSALPSGDVLLLPGKPLASLFPLFLWTAIYCAAFAAANVFVYFPWYFIPLYPSYFVLMLVGLAWLAEHLAPSLLIRARLTAWGVPVMLLLLSVSVLILPQRIRAQHAILDAWIAKREDAYRQAAEYVLSNSSSDQRIGAGEIGSIGFYSGRYMVDVNGLVTPRRPEEGKVETFLRYQPEWLIDGSHGVSATLSRMPEFQGQYEQAWCVPGTTILVFRRR